MIKTTYHFGHLLKTINIFGYPRTGSHFFNYCLAGLFDVVSLPHIHLHHKEAIDRQNEVNPEVLYAIGLRQPGIPFQPVHFNPVSNGVHGVPVESELPSIVLIRDPVATAYSRYRVERDRWGGIANLTAEWLRHELLRYTAFYDEALTILRRQGERGLLVRWEDLIAGPDILEQLVSFVGLQPKLRPSFVWQLLRFDNFVRPGERTFYRSGSNNIWMADPEWVACLSGLHELSFERFGYTPLSCLPSADPVAVG